MKPGNATHPNEEKRNILLEAISALAPSATRGAVDELVWQDFNHFERPSHSIGKLLHHMVADGILTYERDLYTIVEPEKFRRRSNGGQSAARMAEVEPVPLTDEQHNRPGYAVTLYSEPTMVENVIFVKIKPEHGTWVKLPIFGNVRVCLGPGEVDWGAERISNRGLCAVQLVMKNGSVQEIAVNPSHVITFASEE